MPNASAAECAVGSGVAIAANHRHAGLRQTLFRTDDVHDALLVAIEAEAADAKLAAIGFKLGDLRGRDFINDRQ